MDVGCLEGGACGCRLCRGVEPVDVGCQRVEPVDVGCVGEWSLWMWAV